MSVLPLENLLADFVVKAYKAIINAYKKRYGTKKQDLERGEGETFAQLTDLQVKAIVLEKSYSSWLEGHRQDALDIIKNSGLFEDLPKSNPSLVEWFQKHMGDIKTKIIGAVRAMRALEKEIGYELYSIRVDLSLMPKVSVTFQKYRPSELAKSTT